MVNVHKDKYALCLLILFVLFWIIMAIAPTYRLIWAVENVLPVVAVLFLFATYRKFSFSTWSYTLIFLLLVLHTIGSHYSYSEMPLFDALKEPLGFERNNYDRIVHLFSGFVLFFPLYEYFDHKLKVPAKWSAFFAVATVLSIAAFYEMIEFAAVAWTEDLSENFLGMQGDIFDTQIDMFLGLLGSLVGWVTIGLKKGSQILRP